MVLATGFFVVNDSMMKLVAEALPPYQVLMLRGVAALLWGTPLVLLAGYASKAPLVFERRVLARNLAETGAILCYVVALANMPIADATALGQVTPLLVLLGAAFLFGERISRSGSLLIACGFAGACWSPSRPCTGFPSSPCWRWRTRCSAPCVTSSVGGLALMCRV